MVTKKIMDDIQEKIQAIGARKTSPDTKNHVVLCRKRAGIENLLNNNHVLFLCFP